MLALSVYPIIPNLNWALGYPSFFDIFLKSKGPLLTESLFYKLSLIVHVLSAPTILFLGALLIGAYFFQNLALHKFLGKAYVILVLFFAAPSGIVIGFHPEGDPVSIYAFLILGMSWFAVTLIGYQKVKAKEIWPHKYFMIISYGLACSAPFQRIISAHYMDTLQNSFGVSGQFLYFSTIISSICIPMIGSLILIAMLKRKRV